MSEFKKFFAWVVSQGEEKGESMEYYTPSDAAEMLVSKKMPGIFDEAEDEEILVNVRSEDGIVHRFDVRVDISIRARPLNTVEA